MAHAQPTILWPSVAAEVVTYQRLGEFQLWLMAKVKLISKSGDGYDIDVWPECIEAIPLWLRAEILHKALATRVPARFELKAHPYFFEILWWPK